jgi:cell shape-determining protein MreC
MAARSFAPNVIAAAALCAAAVALLVASPELTRAIRAAVLDATRPGQRAAASAVQRVDAALVRFRAADDAADRPLPEDLDAWKLRARQWELEAAALREKLTRIRETGPPLAAPLPSEPLIAAELIEASVLGTEHARQWRSGRFIDKGTIDGIPEAALVVESTDPVIDQGSANGMATGQPVYAGRCVVGRVALAGRRMSTIQPVTHPEYRGFAQIVRHSAEGATFGPRGILEGRGEPLCRLKIIDTTASIEVGDHVYTGERDGTLPYPMYYGRVVSADLDPQTLAWNISVEPTVQHIEGRTVSILCRTINPLSQAAN